MNNTMGKQNKGNIKKAALDYLKTGKFPSFAPKKSEMRLFIIEEAQKRVNKEKENKNKNKSTYNKPKESMDQYMKRRNKKDKLKNVSILI